MPRWYRGARVLKTVIREYARAVAERFHPEKIILFGSHAYGTPHADSDVDILVVMPLATRSIKPCALIEKSTRRFRWISSCVRRQSWRGA